MTTTYELYTNENGTPKAVEGKAPAILERVEALEESLGEGVVTSVNGATGDVTPEQTGCLPLGGGTMTGEVKMSVTNALAKTSNDGELRILGGKNASGGAYCKFFGVDHASYAGQFSFVANNGTTQMYLVGEPDGTLTWSGKDVITSAGGTITGAFDAPYVFAKKSTDDSELNLYGSTAENHGGRLALYGQDSQWSHGGFNLIAANAKTNQWWALSGEANGSLTWGGKNVVCVESWRSGTQWYRKYSDGWIEQGGIATSYSDFEPLTFPTAFTNTNYSIVGSFSADTLSDSTSWSWYSRKTTSISGRTFTLGLQGTCYYMWYACGY